MCMLYTLKLLQTVTTQDGKKAFSNDIRFTSCRVNKRLQPICIELPTSVVRKVAARMPNIKNWNSPIKAAPTPQVSLLSYGDG